MDKIDKIATIDRWVDRGKGGQINRGVDGWMDGQIDR